MDTQCRVARALFAAVLGTIALGTGLARAQTNYHVNGLCGDDAWTGTSSSCAAPNGPKRSIQAGINAAAPGDTVVVAAATYTGAGNKNLDFAGKGIIVRGTGGDPALCVIDCEGSGRGFWFHSGETQTAVLEGFTITHGPATDGGGVFCESGSGPRIERCRFIANTASFGGGVECTGSSPALIGCTFENNTTLGPGTAGGAMDNFMGSSPTLTDCVFTNNSSNSAGAVSNYGGSSPVFVRCAFQGNSALVNGGAVIDETGCFPVFTDCEFRGNSAGGRGGAVANLDAGEVFINCLFAGNTAASWGGAIRSGSSTVKAINCTFAGNSAPGTGGAISAGASTNSPPSVVPSVTALSNCVLWGNTAPTGPQAAIQLGNAPPTPPNLIVSFSDVQGTQAGVYIQGGTALTWGSGNIGSDPLFVDAPGGDFRLRAGSGCADAGDNAGVPGGVMTDLGGDPRFVDDRCATNAGIPGGAGGAAIVDMGAYERQPCYADCNADCAGTVADFGCFQTKFVLADPYADCNADGQHTVADFGCFQTKFVAGCP